ncbi:MAG: hypothetical protein ACD_29C00314G0001 [uncultured bacterium]|nr:MAG: hypothetical protein ACD_29C00314G0001 [uncultured bacterium]
MNKIKTAVIGTGYLGKYHVEKFAQLPQSKLIAVCDINAEHSRALSEKYHVATTTDYRSLVGEVDAVSIATPTPSHFEIGNFFLENGIHVLLEKPIATTVKEADILIKTAKKNKVVLQVGHLERFNSVLKSILPILTKPRFIESHRLAPFKLRGSDVNVVLDLMIHDIDIILSLVKSEITDIRANGSSVLTPFIDIANARLEFANGCVASVTASRVSIINDRRIRIFQNDCFIGLDLDRKKYRIHRKGGAEMFPGIPNIEREKKRIDKGDALLEEIESFLNTILNKTNPVVTGEDAKKALYTAIKITQIVHESEKRFCE